MRIAFLLDRPMEVYAKGLKKQSGLTDDFPAIKGDTKPGIRHKWLSQFKVRANWKQRRLLCPLDPHFVFSRCAMSLQAGTISVLLLSQVGDVGIDLPSANVVIEIDAQGTNGLVDQSEALPCMLCSFPYGLTFVQVKTSDSLRSVLAVFYDPRQRVKVLKRTSTRWCRWTLRRLAI